MQDGALCCTWSGSIRAKPGACRCTMPSWHQGVIGILAARIRERFHRPVIAFAPGADGELKGSGRSIPGLHLRDALDLVRQTPSRPAAALWRTRGRRRIVDPAPSDFERFRDGVRRRRCAACSRPRISQQRIDTDGALPGPRNDARPGAAPSARSSGDRAFRHPRFHGLLPRVRPARAGRRPPEAARSGSRRSTGAPAAGCDALRAGRAAPRAHPRRCTGSM